MLTASKQCLAIVFHDPQGQWDSFQGKLEIIQIGNSPFHQLDGLGKARSPILEHYQNGKYHQQETKSGAIVTRLHGNKPVAAKINGKY